MNGTFKSSRICDPRLLTLRIPAILLCIPPYVLHYSTSRKDVWRSRTQSQRPAKGPNAQCQIQLLAIYPVWVDIYYVVWIICHLTVQPGVIGRGIFSVDINVKRCSLLISGAVSNSHHPVLLTNTAPHCMKRRSCPTKDVRLDYHRT